MWTLAVPILYPVSTLNTALVSTILTTAHVRAETQGASLSSCLCLPLKLPSKPKPLFVAASYLKILYKVLWDFGIRTYQKSVWGLLGRRGVDSCCVRALAALGGSMENSGQMAFETAVSLPTANIPSVFQHPPKCTSITGLMLSNRWYLGYLKG